jgi:hypothetical protein
MARDVAWFLLRTIFDDLIRRVQRSDVQSSLSPVPAAARGQLRRRDRPENTRRANTHRIIHPKHHRTAVFLHEVAPRLPAHADIAEIMDDTAKHMNAFKRLHHG